MAAALATATVVGTPLAAAAVHHPQSAPHPRQPALHQPVAFPAPARCEPGLTPVPQATTPPWTLQRYAPERLSTVADGRGVTVAVVDSGIDTRHPQLAGQVVGGTDFLDDTDGTLDCVGHGTAVASIIAARPIEGVHFRGLAPAARLLSVRVTENLDSEQDAKGADGSAATFADAIDWAVEKGAKVINLSVVLYNRDDTEVRAAIAGAVAKDVVVVAAVGNRHDKGNPTPFPAAYEGVLGVGAIGEDSVRQPFSGVGPYVDVMAPGRRVHAAAPRRGYQENDGTSYAAPFVAATAALVRHRFPRLSAAEVIARVLATADPAPGEPGSPAYGGGVVNPYRAVTETISPYRPVAAPALPAPTVDSLAQARDARRREARDRALWFAVAAAGVATTVIAAAVIWPRGARRRWRPAGPSNAA